MGQKINPTIFRVGKIQDWKSKYIEKNNNELAKFTFVDIEIKKFIKRIFIINKLILNSYQISYFENKLNIFVTYYIKTDFLRNLKNKQQNNKKIGNKKKIKKFLKPIKKNNKLKNYSNKIYDIKKQKLSNQYKNYLFSTKNKTFFLENLTKSLNQFIDKNLDITINLKQLNKNNTKLINKKRLNIIQKNLVQLRKYEQNEFFTEGINTIFLVIKLNKSANLLSQYIVEQLKKLKRHNFFLRFIKTALKLFNDSKKIKIKIKGRFNGAPRAKYKFILINNISVLTLNSNIDYSEKTSYTANGTLGVKVWICKKN